MAGSVRARSCDVSSPTRISLSITSDSGRFSRAEIVVSRSYIIPDIRIVDCFIDPPADIRAIVDPLFHVIEELSPFLRVKPEYSPATPGTVNQHPIRAGAYDYSGIHTNIHLPGRPSAAP
jgi:hypothetical protein